MFSIRKLRSKLRAQLAVVATRAAQSWRAARGRVRAAVGRARNAYTAYAVALRAFRDTWRLSLPKIVDMFRAEVPLGDAADILRDAIGRAGLRHAEDGAWDYRYVILASGRSSYPLSRACVPDRYERDNVRPSVEHYAGWAEFEPSRRVTIRPSDLNAVIRQYLDALRAYNART